MVKGLRPVLMRLKICDHLALGRPGFSRAARDNKDVGLALAPEGLLETGHYTNRSSSSMSGKSPRPSNQVDNTQNPDLIAGSMCVMAMLHQSSKRAWVARPFVFGEHPQL